MRRLPAVPLGTSSDPQDPDAQMSIDVFQPEGVRAEKVAVVIHGRNGNSDSPHMMKVVRPYLRRGYAVVSANLCASEWNGSAGTGADFTIGQHLRDARRVVQWTLDNAEDQGWRTDGLVLAGHSMGGYAVLRLAAEEFEGRIAHVLAVSTFTSGARQIEVRRALAPDGIEVLARECPRALDEWPTHDILALADRLTLPVGIVAGRGDMVTPPANCKELFDLLPDGICYLVMPEAQHCMEGETSEAVIEAALVVLDQTRRESPAA
ncbi:alpha/beta hydrolase family protein [Methylobrevis pamukkalensis]|uniref:Alpha/beta hydrolase family protein n=1 Tax=Methylobrevis pamukkalensis TaxID=1439726 RepID=A0A1E3H1S1_9HYPH|nr:alpha/beta fold hydrolase [Methylobrevis pamukkalensis]ODN70260.1 Alpha/beta hydrolase family protein [Methylobrevis pamukkalensis]